MNCMQYAMFLLMCKQSSLFDEYGVVVPINLDNPHAVAQVLTQESGKLKLKYLKDGNCLCLLVYLFVLLSNFLQKLLLYKL